MERKNFKSVAQLQDSYRGTGNPWFLRSQQIPHYSEFIVHWRDFSGREYMFIDDRELAVRLRIRKNYQPPSAGDHLDLIEAGTGKVYSVVVREVHSQLRSGSVWRFSIL